MATSDRDSLIEELRDTEARRDFAEDFVDGYLALQIKAIRQQQDMSQEELAEKGQSIKGAIIALEDDPKIRRALTVTTNIDFYRYQVSFKLLKV